MKTYGLTGGIGMGKSTAARLLRERGVAVVDSDDLARELVQPGEPALAQIQTAFGQEMISADGQLSREKLAALVFADSTARNRLETILHPRIQERWRAQLKAWSEEGRIRAAVIIPLLFETRVESEFDQVVCLACSAATQQQRLRDRGWTPEQIQQRNAAQLPVADKMARAHRVIWNEGDLDTLARQCDRVFP